MTSERNQPTTHLTKTTISLYNDFYPRVKVKANPTLELYFNYPTSITITNMSDIQKKTLPPGSWPGSKGGAKTAETTSDAGVPRSAPSIPKETASDIPDDDASASQGEYTHQKEPEAALDDITEEEGSAAPIKMQDEDASEEPESLKDVEPEAIQEDVKSAGGDDKTPQSQTEEQQSQKELGEEEVPEAAPPSEAASSALTESAKKAFDAASENQPTSEARESFLQSAKDDAATTATGITGKQSEQPAPTATEGEGASSELQEGLTETQQEGGETATAPSEFQEGQTAPSELQEGQTAPSEIPEGQTAPSETQQEGEGEPIPSEFQSQSRPQSTTGKTVSFKSPTEESSFKEAGYESQTQSQSHSQAGESQTQLDTQQEDQSHGPQSTAGVTVPDQLDFTVLKDGTVNKGGNIVDSNGRVVGRVTQGILQYLIGKKVDENGDIWSENGKVIGKAEPITDAEREDMTKEAAPFESFEDAVVDGNGMVVSNGEWVGKVVSGDLSVLRGRPVDKDGDILDKGGNVIGKAERWEPEAEPEPEPEAEVDMSILAGKRVNKAGNLVDSSGNIFGRVAEGNVKKMVGRMCDKNGNIVSESGDVIGRAELIPEGEREGEKEGIFAELEGCTVAKDGTVVTPSGDVVGRLVSGDPKVLFGRAVDEDGDVLDKNGNVIGKAERWEPEVVEKKKNIMTGRKVNREGNVVDEDGNIIGKLTSGDPGICSGKEIDDDGDVVDGKGTVIGHCTLLSDIKEGETPEEKAKREQMENDKKMAIQMAVCVEQCLDKIRPICKMITEVGYSLDLHGVEDALTYHSRKLTKPSARLKMSATRKHSSAKFVP